jgi:hypothetical protein
MIYSKAPLNHKTWRGQYPLQSQGWDLRSSRGQVLSTSW